jgi:hypothetical protein
MRILPMRLLSLSSTLLLASAAWVTADGPLQVIRADRTNLLTLAINPNCEEYTWPTVSITSAPVTSPWRLAAARRICAVLSANGVTLGVRADGLVAKVNGQPHNVETFVATLYSGAFFPAQDTRVVVLASGAISFSPASSQATFVSLPTALQRVRRQVQFVQAQYKLEKTVAVIDLKIARDESLAFGGRADQSTEGAAMRATFLESCLARHWDLPYERTILCGLGAAMIRLTP